MEILYGREKKEDERLFLRVVSPSLLDNHYEVR